MFTEHKTRCQFWSRSLPLPLSLPQTRSNTPAICSITVYIYPSGTETELDFTPCLNQDYFCLGFRRDANKSSKSPKRFCCWKNADQHWILMHRSVRSQWVCAAKLLVWLLNESSWESWETPAETHMHEIWRPEGNGFMEDILTDQHDHVTIAQSFCKVIQVLSTPNCFSEDYCSKNCKSSLWCHKQCDY